MIHIKPFRSERFTNKICCKIAGYNLIKILVVLNLILSGCSKAIDFPPKDECLNPPCDTISKQDTGKLKLLWKIPILDGDFSFGANLYSHQQDLIITYSRNGVPASIRRFDPIKKEFLWERNPFPEDYFSSEFIREDVIILNNWSRTISMDPLTGDTNWEDDVYPDRNGMPRTTLIGDYFYHTHTDIVGNSNECHLVRRHIYNSEPWDTIYSVRKTEVEGFAPSIEMPSLWMHPETGDSILMFQHRMHKFGFNLGRIDIIAWNLSQNSLFWRIDNIAENSNVIPLLIYRDLAYFMNSTNQLFCFDLIQGTVKWQKTLVSNLTNLVVANYKIIDDNLMVKSPDRVMFYLDPLTGETIWQNEILFPGINTGADFIEYKDWYIEANGENLDIIRKSDGTLVYGIRKTALRFRGQMVLDLEKRLLYVPEQYSLLCYELPEEF